MSKRYKVGIVGLGAIGLQIARTIDQGNLTNFDLMIPCGPNNST